MVLAPDEEESDEYVEPTEVFTPQVGTLEEDGDQHDE